VRFCPTSGSRLTPRHVVREPHKLAERDAESVATNPGADGDTLTIRQQSPTLLLPFQDLLKKIFVSG
jgi:hypothetical protein